MFKGVTIIKLFKAVVMLTIFSVLTKILSFIYRIYLTRVISPEMLGVYTIAISVFLVFCATLNSGIPSTISKFVAQNKKNNNINSIVTSGLIVNLIICIIVVIIIFITKNIFLFTILNTQAYNILIALIPALIFTAIYAPFRGFLWGREEYFKVGLVEFIEQIIKMVSFFILVMMLSSDTHYISTGWAISIAGGISTIIGLAFYFKSKGRIQKTQFEIIPIIKASAPITSVKFMSSIMQPFLSILIPIQLVKVGFTSEQALSQLGIAMGMSVPILLIPTTIIGALSMALIPKISSLQKENNNSQLKKQIRTSVLFTLICCFVLIPVFMSVGKEISLFIFKNAQAGDFLVNSAWIVVPMGMAQLTSSIINSLGLEIKGFKFYLISSTFLLVSVLFLPKYIGIYSLLYGMGFANTITTFLNIHTINKTIKDKNYYLKPIAILIGITLAIKVFITLTKNVLLAVFPTSVVILLITTITVICFISLTFALGLINVEVLMYSIKQSLKSRKSNKSKASPALRS